MELDGEVRGVFALSKRGNILAHIDLELLDATICERILDCLLSQTAPIKGILGNWEAINAISTVIVYNGIWQQASRNMKEISFTLEDLTEQKRDDHVRYLELRDYPRWRKFRLEYLLECGLSQDLSEAQLEESFRQAINDKKHWGYFIDDSMVSTCTINAHFQDISQVGGVYTSPLYRSQGIAKKLVSHQLCDLYNERQIKRSALFTNKENITAQKVYEKLGFVKAGLYGMIFP